MSGFRFCNFFPSSYKVPSKIPSLIPLKYRGVYSLGLSRTGFIDFMRYLDNYAVNTYGYKKGIITSHAAHETGFGKSIIGRNLFGIKCTSYWINKGGSCVNARTHEEIKGTLQPYTMAFRYYDKYMDSVLDVINLIKRLTGYAYAWNNRNNPVKYFEGLVIGHYATDSRYADKCIDVYNYVKQYI